MQENPHTYVATWIIKTTFLNVHISHTISQQVIFIFLKLWELVH